MTLSRPAKVLALLAALLMPIVIMLAALSSMETASLFPVSSVPAAPPPPGGRALAATAADGETRLRGWHVPPASRANGNAVIVGFGGNAWNAATLAETLARLFPGDDVVVFHYRGYPPSGGKPSAAALVDDAPLVFDQAATIAQGRPVVGIGLSLGAGVAATLAAKRPVTGLILVTPFDSLKKVAAGHLPWAPVSLLFRNEIDAVTALQSNQVPVAIIAASDDTIIPRARTDELRRAVRNRAFDRTIEGTGHNDIYAHPDFRPTLLAARESLRQ